MGLYDRDYTRADFNSHYGRAPQMRMSLPKVTPVVKWLLIINIAVFLLTFLIPPVGALIFHWFSVYPATRGMSLQLWRQITYQFIHADLGHVSWNMFILFFFGPMFERLWGGKKFLTFYLVCGAMGGLLYPMLAIVGWLDVAYLVGASGSILGMLAAGAILFPNTMVLVFFVFPVRLVFVTLILAGISIITLLRPDQFSNAGGEAAHLGGMAAGAIYVFFKGRLPKFKLKTRPGRWEKQMAEKRDLQLELDRILQKVHDTGIHSLTRSEKKVLQQATEAQQRQNKL